MIGSRAGLARVSRNPLLEQIESAGWSLARLLLNVCNVGIAEMSFRDVLVRLLESLNILRLLLAYLFSGNKQETTYSLLMKIADHGRRVALD